MILPLPRATYRLLRKAHSSHPCPGHRRSASAPCG